MVLSGFFIDSWSMQGFVLGFGVLKNMKRAEKNEMNESVGRKHKTMVEIRIVLYIRLFRQRLKHNISL